MRLRHAGILLPLLVLTLAADDRVEVSLSDRSVLEERLSMGLVPNDSREAALAGLFRSAGCEVELQKVSKKANNVICKLKGTSREVIVAGGHYDFVKEGRGIIDDWSGAAMLVSLFQALRTQPRNRTVKFIGFAREEDGFEGSSKFVHGLTQEERQSIRAFVNLECLGTSPLKVWGRRSTPELLFRLDQLAASLQTGIARMNVDGVGDDDTRPFFDAKLPVISLHSLTRETLALIHSRRDRLDSVRLDDYYESYKFIAFFLAYLDLKPLSDQLRPPQ